MGDVKLKPVRVVRVVEVSRTADEYGDLVRYETRVHWRRRPRKRRRRP